MKVKITPNFKDLASYQPSASKKDIYTSKSPLPSRRVIMPSPKNVEWKKGRFQLQAKAQLFHAPSIKNYAKRAESFFGEKFQISLHGSPLDKRWKHCWILCNENLPETLDSNLETMKNH
ncbi:MAG: hypothetical protein L3J39_02880 [Verrucomicrobiales bacterium]|nr:hypothetical protein [Verrucomicrobiales bacterium]